MIRTGVFKFWPSFHRPESRAPHPLDLHGIVRLIVEPHRAKESCAVDQLRVDVAQKVHGRECYTTAHSMTPDSRHATSSLMNIAAGGPTSPAWYCTVWGSTSNRTAVAVTGVNRATLNASLITG